MSLKSSSSLKSTTARDRFREWTELARLSRVDTRKFDFSDLQASFELHDQYARTYLGCPLTECKVIEIGYGARPIRLIWMLGQGVDITGIDLDPPILSGSPLEIFRIYRRNGWERALKTAGRWFINERHTRRAMLTELSRRKGSPFILPTDRLEVGDAASPGFWAKHPLADYVFSEDVFEHIPADSLQRLVPMIARSMHPKGIAYVKPMVFTGICGGHQLEWYPHTIAQPRERRTEPWEHLRKNRHPADTYLNRLQLADYRKLFADSFEILEETVVSPGLGCHLMTSEIRNELSAYSDEELFSNQVIFILRPLS